MRGFGRGCVLVVIGLVVGSGAVGACDGESTTNTVDAGGGKTVTFMVEPAAITKAAGETQAFAAFATSSDGVRGGVTQFASWSSSDPAVATIDARTGVATAVAAGTATITASYENILATATFTVGVTGVDAGSEGGPQTAAQELFVGSYGGEGVPPSIRIFAASAEGDVAPLRTIVGTSTQLGAPNQMLVRGDELFVSDGNKAILVFDARANGDVAPLRAIRGVDTTFTSFSPVGLALNGPEVWVADQTRGILIFPANGNGSVAPTRTINAPFAQHLALGAEEVIVSLYSPAVVRVHERTAAQTDPAINSFATGLLGPKGVALGTNAIYVASTGGNVSKTIDDSISVFEQTATGGPPVRTIAGLTNTGLHDPTGLALAGDELFVANQQESAVRVFAAQATGDVLPKRVLKGPATGLRFTSGIAVRTSP